MALESRRSPAPSRRFVLRTTARVLAVALVGTALLHLTVTMIRQQEAVTVGHQLDLTAQTLTERVRGFVATEEAAMSRMAVRTVLDPPEDADDFRNLAIASSIPGECVWLVDTRGGALEVMHGWPDTAPALEEAGVLGWVEPALAEARRTGDLVHAGGSTILGRPTLAVVHPLRFADRLELSAFLVSIIDLEHVARLAIDAQVDWEVELVDAPGRGRPSDAFHREYLVFGEVVWQFTVHRPADSGGDDLVWTIRIGGILATTLLACLVVLWSRRGITMEELRSAAALNEEKGRFLLKLSHEIRTPLTAVVGFLDILRVDSGLTSEERREFLAHATVEAEEISAAVHDVLVLCRDGFDELMLVSQPFDVVEEVSAVMGRYDSGVHVKTLVVDLAGPVWATADPLRVRQIVRNLVSNAVRHGGSTIEVGVSSRGDRTVVVVADDGPGLPDEVAEALEAGSSDEGGSGRTEGLGLGLTVSARLADLMGGSLVYRRGADRTSMELQLASATPVDCPAMAVSRA